MSRPTVHAPDALLDAARAVLIRAGVENTTIQAIAEESGAPVGSLYNRFRSRRELLAQLWLRAAQRSQAAALPALEHEDPYEAAVACALSQVEFTRREHADARLLASFRREDLLGEAQTPALVQALEELNRPVESALRELSRRMFGDTRAEHRRKLAFAMLDMPLAAVRRYLLADKPVPAEVAVWLERAVRAVLADD
jgi:AcrR family transcriptional regulator